MTHHRRRRRRAPLPRRGGGDLRRVRVFVCVRLSLGFCLLLLLVSAGIGGGGWRAGCVGGNGDGERTLVRRRRRLPDRQPLSYRCRLRRRRRHMLIYLPPPQSCWQRSARAVEFKCIDYDRVIRLARACTHSVYIRVVVVVVIKAKCNVVRSWCISGGRAVCATFAAVPSLKCVVPDSDARAAATFSSTIV